MKASFIRWLLKVAGNNGELVADRTLKIKPKRRREELGLLCPCPLCKRQPKAYSFWSEGRWTCLIECRPFLGKRHLAVQVKGENWGPVSKEAAELWGDLAFEREHE